MRDVNLFRRLPTVTQLMSSKIGEALSSLRQAIHASFQTRTLSSSHGTFTGKEVQKQDKD